MRLTHSEQMRINELKAFFQNPHYAEEDNPRLRAMEEAMFLLLKGHTNPWDYLGGEHGNDF